MRDQRELLRGGHPAERGRRRAPRRASVQSSYGWATPSPLRSLNWSSTAQATDGSPARLANVAVYVFTVFPEDARTASAGCAATSSARFVDVRRLVALGERLLLAAVPRAAGLAGRAVRVLAALPGGKSTQLPAWQKSPAGH